MPSNGSAGVVRVASTHVEAPDARRAVVAGAGQPFPSGADRDLRHARVAFERLPVAFVSTSQTLSSPGRFARRWSYPPETRSLLSGEKASALTGWVWPCSTVLPRDEIPGTMR